MGMIDETMDATEASKLSADSKLNNILRGIKTRCEMGSNTLKLFCLDINPFDGTVEGYKHNWEYDATTLAHLEELGYKVTELCLGTIENCRREKGIFHEISWVCKK